MATRFQDAEGRWWISIATAATETRKARTTILSWVTSGKICSLKIAGKRWVREDEVFTQLRHAVQTKHANTLAKTPLNSTSTHTWLGNLCVSPGRQTRTFSVCVCPTRAL